MSKWHITAAQNAQSQKQNWQSNHRDHNPNSNWRSATTCSSVLMSVQHIHRWSLKRPQCLFQRLPNMSCRPHGRHHAPRSAHRHHEMGSDRPAKLTKTRPLNLTRGFFRTLHSSPCQPATQPTHNLGNTDVWPRGTAAAKHCKRTHNATFGLYRAHPATHTHPFACLQLKRFQSSRLSTRTTRLCTRTKH